MATEEHDAEEEQQDWPEAARLVEVTLDDASIGRNNAEVEHEREAKVGPADATQKERQHQDGDNRDQKSKAAH